MAEGSAMSERVRVLVLGGGMAGVSAAFRLSDTKAKRERFAVTLLEASWRLGGKGATGRDPSCHQRVEEHGLHVWMGFYEHAFALVRDALARVPAELGPIDALFRPDYAVELADARGRVTTLRLPPRPGLPWQPEQRDFASLLVELARWARATLASELELGPLAELALCVARGLVIDVLPHGNGGFERIDRFDLREWLRRHGARDEAVLDAPPLLALYALAFAHPDGQAGPGRGSVAAGAALRTLARILFGYHGAPFWRMSAGMGDSVLVPIHHALIEQSVRIEWLTRVEALLPAADAPRLDAIAIRRRIQPHDEYDPLIEVRGRPAWPNCPRIDPPIERERELLRIGEHFDLAVLAIPIDLHPTIAPALLERVEPLRAMVEHHRSVATRSLQVWLRSPVHDPARARIGSGLPAPYSSWGELGEVLDVEDWPAHDRPRSLYYFVDVCPDPSDEHEAARLAERFVREGLQRCVPGAELACPPYARINAAPGERYILTPPGSTRFRLSPGQSGIQNLFLAGDWTKTSINGGSVEAAAESGVEAAKVIVERFG